VEAGSAVFAATGCGVAWLTARSAPPAAAGTVHAAGTATARPAGLADAPLRANGTAAGALPALANCTAASRRQAPVRMSSLVMRSISTGATPPR